MTVPSKQITYQSELARKSIHLLSVLIPIIYLQIGHQAGIITLCLMTATSILFDVLLHYHAPTRKLMLAVVGKMLRHHEIRSDKFYLTGASWVLIAATMSFLLFPTIVAISAFTILIVSDTTAALFGRQFGKHRFLDKSMEGSGAFFISAVGVIAVWGAVLQPAYTYYVCGVLGAVGATIAEAASSRIGVDDNITIPFNAGIVMIIFAYVLQYLNFPQFLFLLP